MATVKLFKETTLPGSLQAHAVYFVAPAAHPNYLEVYVTDAAGTATRRTHRVEDIQAMIDTSIAGLGGSIEFVADIAERDALSPSNGEKVYVENASDDPSVTSGAATYIYRQSTTSWIKDSESEAMDLVLTWAGLTDGPSSSPAQVDAAVAASHSHNNKTQLDKVGQDANGDMTYDGQNIRARLETSSW